MSFIDKAREAFDRTEDSLHTLLAAAIKAQAYGEIIAISLMTASLAALADECEDEPRRRTVTLVKDVPINRHRPEVSLPTLMADAIKAQAYGAVTTISSMAESLAALAAMAHEHNEEARDEVTVRAPEPGTQETPVGVAAPQEPEPVMPESLAAMAPERNEEARNWHTVTAQKPGAQETPVGVAAPPKPQPSWLRPGVNVDINSLWFK